MARTKKKHFLSLLKSRAGLSIALVVVLFLIGGGVWALRDDSQEPAATGTTGTKLPEPEAEKPYVNLNAPTKTDKQETDAHKDELTNQQNKPTTNPSTGKKDVTVIVTSADQSYVRAYAQGIVEDNGACTATITKGSQTYTQTSQGFSNVSQTNCAIDVSSLQLGSSGWSVVVSYSSATSSGKSQSYTVQ
jgi:hypothetical protein